MKPYTISDLFLKIHAFMSDWVGLDLLKYLETFLVFALFMQVVDNNKNVEYFQP